MNAEAINIFFTESFMNTWLLFNFIFLCMGIALGAFLFYRIGANKAYKKGQADSREEFKAKNEIFSTEVASKLSELKNGLLQSAQAYQEAIKVIESHLEIGESLQLTSEEKPLIENKQFTEVIAEDIDITDTAEFKKVVGA